MADVDIAPQVAPTPPAPVAAQAPGDDAVKKDFLAGRAVAQNGNIEKEFQSLIEPAAPAAAQGEVAGAQTAASAAPAAASTLPFGARVMLNVIQNGFAGAARDGAVSAAKDVGTGIIDAPRQMIGGAVDAVNGLSTFAGDVADSIHRAGLPDAFIQLTDPKTGEWAPKVLSPEEAQASGDKDLLHIPTTGDPSTITGNIIRTGTQFMLGRMPFLKAGEVAGMTGTGLQIGSDFGSAATAFDPSQKRLSNAIDDVAPNFVTDWLKAKPEDEGTMLGHLKSGLEMAGLGTMFEGAKRTLGAIKDAAPEGMADSFGSGSQLLPTTAPTEAAPAKPFLPLGDTAQPVVGIKGQQSAALPEATPEIQQQAADYLSGRSGTNPVTVNLARIGSADDIKNTVAQISTYIPKGAVQSNDATIALADASGLSPADFLAGYQGKNLDATQTTAMRFMLDSSAEQLMSFAKAASDSATATPEAQATFLRAFSTHRALQQYASNAATEAGRTLQSWSIMSQQRSDYSKAIGDLIQGVGADDVKDMAGKIASLDSPLQAGKLVASSMQGTGRDTFLKYYYNVLLSNPKTVIKKLASDTTLNMWNLATHYVAENYGESGDVPPGETAQRAYGYISSFKDGLRLAGKALTSGESQMSDTPMDALKSNKIGQLADGAPAALSADAPTEAAVNYLKAAMPSNWITAANDFQEFINYRSAVRGLAFRDGLSKGLETGSPELEDHVSGVMDNIPPEIHEQAMASARYNAFMEPLTGWQKTGQNMLNQMNIPIAHTDLELPVGRILMPFYTVPANIAKWGYRNSALSGMFPSDIIKDQLAAGGATRDLAVARMGLGSAVALSMADLALNGAVTGKGPSTPEMQEAWKNAGNEQYSVKIGGKYYGYNNVEPIGMMMGAIADTFDAMKFATEKDKENLASSLIFGAGNAMLSKTYMQGMANFFSALQNPDTDGNKWADNVMSSFAVPAGIKGLDDATDKWYRAHYDLMQTVQSKTPFASGQLPELLNLWGDPIEKRAGFMPLMSGTGIARMLSPVPIGPSRNAEPIDKWIWDNHTEFSGSPDGKLGLSKPGIVQNFSAGSHVSTQVELSPQQLYRLQKLSGNELKDPSTGLGSKDFLNSLVSGTNPDQGQQRMWDTASPAVKAVMVQAIFNKFKTAAKQQLLQEDPQLKSTVETGWTTKANQLTAQ